MWIQKKGNSAYSYEKRGGKNVYLGKAQGGVFIPQKGAPVELVKKAKQALINAGYLPTKKKDTRVMTVAPVQSRFIKAGGYDKATKTMQVHIADKVYNYLGVPEKVFGNFMRAPSKGSYFEKHIRGKFKTVKVEGEQPAL
jgi:hypothetical protein